MSVVCGPVEFSATGRSILPKNPTECSVSEYDLEILMMRRPRLARAVKPWEKNGVYLRLCRSQWPRDLRHRSTAARLLGLWVRIPPGAWMFICCECFVVASRGLCDGLITRPEESYRLWCVVVCDLENLMNEEPYTINVIELNIGDTSLDVFPTCH